MSVADKLEKASTLARLDKIIDRPIEIVTPSELRWLMEKIIGRAVNRIGSHYNAYMKLSTLAIELARDLRSDLLSE